MEQAVRYADYLTDKIFECLINEINTDSLEKALEDALIEIEIAAQEGLN